MAAAEELSSVVGVKRACQDLSVARAGVYRRRQRRLSPPLVGARATSARRLKDEEKSIVLACLHEQRFQDCSPAQVYASLLDDGRYHCSIRTMYRLLDAEGENRERRDQLIHPPYRGRNCWQWPQSTLELGHHQTARTGEMELLLPVCDSGCLQPLCHRWMISYRETAAWPNSSSKTRAKSRRLCPAS